MKIIIRQPCVRRSGYTLVEMLVALTASLILFGVVMTIFGTLGEAVSKSRRVGALDRELCAISTALLEDLVGVTAVRNAMGLVTSPDSGAATGYFEIIEGPSFDAVSVTLAGGLIDKSVSGPHDPATGSDDRIVGDTDDMLFFTTQSVTVEPFIGKFLNETKNSREAEVAYFCTRTPDTSNPQLYTLHRRQLLIMAGAPLARFDEFGRYRTFTDWEDFYSKFDISARREVLDESDIAVLNTANDLQLRRNRIGHDPSENLPFDWELPENQVCPIDPSNDTLPLARDRKGEDVIARNVLSFDVRVLDSSAMERTGAAFPVRLSPSDPGYWSAGVDDVSPQSPIYVDLGYGAFSDLYSELYATPIAAPSVSQFSRWSKFAAPESILIGDAKQPKGRTYDTWTTFYQSNMVDDGMPGPADDHPPYPANLRAIQVTIRLYDAQSKTIRQRTIVHSFAN